MGKNKIKLRGKSKECFIPSTPAMPYESYSPGRAKNVARAEKTADIKRQQKGK